MTGVARVGQDNTGGTIIGALAPTVFVNGRPIAVKDAAVTPYGDGCKSAPRLGQGSRTVFAEGRSVCRKLDLDVCGTPISSSSTDVIIEG